MPQSTEFHRWRMTGDMIKPELAGCESPRVIAEKKFTK